MHWILGNTCFWVFQKITQPEIEQLKVAVGVQIYLGDYIGYFVERETLFWTE